MNPRVIGPLCTLPTEELLEVQGLPVTIKRDYIVAGYVDFTQERVILFRGDGMSLVAPMSMFTGRPTTPDFEQFSITDYGQTLVFGPFEAAVDSVLYDLDPQYKSKVDANRVTN